MTQKHALLLEQAQRLKTTFAAMESTLEDTVFISENDVLTLHLRGQTHVEELKLHQPNADIASALKIALQHCINQYNNLKTQTLHQIDQSFQQELK